MTTFESLTLNIVSCREGSVISKNIGPSMVPRGTPSTNLQLLQKELNYLFKIFFIRDKIQRNCIQYSNLN